MKTPFGSQECEATWIVDGSGRAASFARECGARKMIHDRLVSVLATFTAPDASDADSRTLVESAPCGWWYTSRVPGRRRIVAFHTDAGSEGARLARSPAGFVALLASTRHVAARVADHGYTMEHAPRIFPANTSILDRFGGPGWIAAGDAAVSFDPLSSQGILTALYGGLNAARTIHDSMHGRPDALARYDRKLRDVFEAYRRNRDPLYGRETRWPEEPFWKSRLSTRDTTRDTTRNDAGHDAEYDAEYYAAPRA
jgi:flavin-dependent dehydrogenase